jgi:hypothetical protein
VIFHSKNELNAILELFCNIGTISFLTELIQKKRVKNMQSGTAARVKKKKKELFCGLPYSNLFITAGDNWPDGK